MNKVYLVDFKYYYITTKTKTKLEKWFKGKNEKHEITRIEQLDDDGLWVKDDSPEAIKRLGVSRNTFYRRMWEYEDAMGIPRKGDK